MVKILSASYEMKFTGYIALSTRIPKIYFFGQGGPNFGGETAGKFRENGQKQENLLLCKLGSGQF